MDKITDGTILDCGHTPSEHGKHTTGYGESIDGKTSCYACCAKLDRAQMKEEGRITLYLTDYTFHNKWDIYSVGTVSNWPASLKISCTVKRGSHNIAGTRYDCWFEGPDGFIWWGVNYGENSELCHCKRTKRKAA